VDSRRVRFLLVVFLVGISLFLFLKNYIVGTWLVGWDSLHPEFNFSLAFERMVSGVWREDQGIGAIAAHSSMADLPRTVLLWVGSLIIPTSFIRYISILTSLCLGPLGMYLFLEYIFWKEKQNWSSLAGSFLGSLFYLLNLITLQQFFVPFEMFLVAYATIPWVFYLAIKYLAERKKKNLILFALVIFLSAPMAYAATLFYTFLACFVVFLLVLSFLEKFKNLKGSLILISLVLLINSFWLLPNIYSVVKQGGIISSSKINQLFSKEAFIRNRDYGGDPTSVAIGKNFLFSWQAFDFSKNRYIELMSVWARHLDSKPVKTIGYATALISLLGIIFSFVKRNKIGVSLLLPFLISLFFIVNINPPLGDIYSFFYKDISIFREGLRMPFTKFSIPFLFGVSFYFGYFCFTVFAIISKKFVTKLLILPISLSITVALITYMLPSFRGNLISGVVRTQMPDYYKQAFVFFNINDEGRVAILPMNTEWGWQYNNWKYEGSGFLGFGIKNPLLIRDYDRWSIFNESFYNEASFALYSKDLTAFEKTIEKYQVRYLLLDESVINAGGDNKLLFTPEFKRLVSHSAHIKFVKEFGFLKIYETNFIKSEKYVWSPMKYASVNANLNYSEIDPIYSEFGDYIQSENGIKFPFVNFDPRSDVNITTNDSKISLSNDKLDARVEIPIDNAIKEDFSQNRGYRGAQNCDLNKRGSISKLNNGNTVTYSAKDDGVSCDYFYYPGLSFRKGYLLRIKGENKEGRGLKIYLQNQLTGRMDLEELLLEGKFDEYFIVLPRRVEIDKGYTLNLETRSFGRIASENEINSIEFFEIPINFLTNLYSGNKSNIYMKSSLSILEVNKTGTWLYKVKTQGSGLLVLGQGYEDGWIAFSGGKVLPHTKVNSWANGWFIDKDGEVIIFFWPHLLEYLGFVFLGITLAWLILAKPVE